MKLKKPTILIIEDNPVDARLIQDILSSSKAFEMHWATSLKEGLNILSGTIPIDAILLDLSLPDSQGLNTLDEVYKKAEHIPVVILTSLDNEDTGLEALQKGAQDYLIKGEVTAHLLVRAIRYAIERKQSEQKLNEALDLNKKIFSASAMGILTYNSSGQCNYANETAGEIINATAAQLLEQNFHKIESWKNSGLYDYAREVLRTKQSRQHQFNFISTFGKNVWVDCSLATYTSNREEYLMVIFRDISKKKFAEEALLSSKSQLTEAMDIAQLFHWEYDVITRMFHFDEKVNTFLGRNTSIPHQNQISIEDYLEKHVFPEDREIVIREIEKARIKADPDYFSQIQYRLIGADRVIKYVLVRIRVTLNSGIPKRFYGIIQDITHQKQVENDLQEYRDHLEKLVETRVQELQEAKIAAESATRIKSEFLANMSHEIRTPLNAIMGFSDMLCTTISDHKQQSQVQAIHSSAKSLMSLINDILDLSKIEAGKLTIEYSPINLSTLIKDIQLIFAQKMQEKGLAFFIDMDYQIPGSLMLDEIRLRQIFFNLIGNAVKFTETGYISINIGVKSKTALLVDLLISIEDTGIGIAADQQKKIFEAFQQQDGQNLKKYGGTGLGLTITKRLVEMMNGSLTLKSIPGEGSIFEILLPNIQISDKQIPAESFFDYESVLFEPATILVCDDNQANRKLIKDLLEKSPLNIIEAEDGKEALDFARKYMPALIFMDMKMPKISGIEVASILKKEEETKNIPIIALSGSSKTILKEEDSINLFESFLLKPLKIEVLFDQLKKYLLLREMKEKDVVSETENLNLTDDQLKNIPVLTDLLEREYLPLYYQVLQNQRIDQIEFFGESLVKSGFQFSIKILENFGQKVRSYADSFEIDKLLTTLHEFPEVIQKIKSLERIK